ncbi:helix-turn-helix domain-containing protein [Domibacillus sp. PGB-M46]|uniref:helix-turn-helix domain-containing protein n=1 Tax=Domibacillus sp. PGB-M46 TaxID=2910255 RepID=UPI001F565A26|nr:helix-turn-helix transcriptional regulator [Domibacillus sp. PGB-M46]MCI2256088.1 helix-turn-helix domain-containing protein [Domibacillus sp. PGB-M46]
MIYIEQQMSKRYANQDHQLKKEEDVEQLIAQNIIRRRKKLGLTQKQMADQLNTQQSVVSRIETGNHNLTIANLKGIAQVLETDVSSLVARETGLAHKRYKLIKR